MSEFPKCSAWPCEDEADCDVHMDGNTGCFDGYLCAKHEQMAKEVLNPSRIVSSLLRIVTSEDLSAALAEAKSP